MSYLGREDLAQTDPNSFDTGGLGKGVQEEKLANEADPATLISKGFSRGQLPDNVVMLGARNKDEEPQADPGSGFEFDPVAPPAPANFTPQGVAEQAEDPTPSYYGEPCPECGHFTLMENGAHLDCDACGWAGTL